MAADAFAAQLNASENWPANTVAQSWGELAPQLRDYVSLVQGMYGFIILIIGLFTATGVLNTMMMAVFERSREIGLVSALGSCILSWRAALPECTDLAFCPRGRTLQGSV